MIDIYELKEKFEELSKKKLKEEARKIVINAEVLSSETEINVMDILAQYVRNMKARRKKPNPYIEYILKNITTRKKSDLYKTVLDSQAINLIKIGENSVGTAKIVKSYYDTIEIVEKGQSKIKGAIAKPITMYSIISIIAFFMLKMIVDKTNNIQYLQLDFLKDIYYAYIPIVLSIGLMIAIPLVKYPSKVPKLKDAYNAINGYKYLSLVKFLLSLGISSQDIDDMFRKSIKEYKPKKKGIDGLTEFLTQFLDDAELAVFIYSIELNKFDITLQGIINAKKIYFDKIIDQSVGFLSETLTLTAAVPIMIAMFGIFSIMMSVMNLATSMGQGM